MGLAKFRQEFSDKWTARHLYTIARYHLGFSNHLFIHIPKNGGLAVRNSLPLRLKLIFADPYFHVSRDYTDRLFETMKRANAHHGAQHARLIDIHPDVRAHLQPVAIVRNPFSRTVSRFKYRFQMAERRGETVDYSPAAFERFLEERHEFGQLEFFWHRAIKGWYSQLDYIRDETGAIPTHVLRQELLSDDIERYFRVKSLRRTNISSKSAPSYSAFYTDKTQQIVADWYKDEIDHFGFDFDTPAQRNFYFEQEDHNNLDD